MKYHKGYIQIKREQKRKQIKAGLLIFAVFIGLIIAMMLAPDF